MRKILLFVFVILMSNITIAQSYNTELNYLGQYVQRMYLNAPFQGAKVIDDIDKCYLICVVSEHMTDDANSTQRKAEVKAMRYANEFLNGSQIKSNTIVRTKQDSDGFSSEEIEDFIESRSMGYIQQMQVISIFIDEQENKNVLVFCKELPIKDKSKKKHKRRKD